MAPAPIIAAAAALLVGSAAAQYPRPNMWPNQHAHREIMYVPDLGTTHIKPVWYDFFNLHYRADVFLAPGSFPNPLAPINQSSYWLGTSLKIYDYFPFPSCVELDLGFGMMTPAWFLGGTQNGTYYSVKKYPYGDDGGMYLQTLSTQSIVDGQGTFDYHSYLNASSYGSAAGDPHHFSAPSPLGFVVNEYNNFTATSFNASDPIFIVPSSPSCINTTIADPFEAVKFHAPFLLPEVLIAAREQGLI